MIQIGIVDDHAIVRTGLRQFFSQQVDLRVVGEAASGREAIDLVHNAPHMDVLVLDLSMPGQGGIDALGMIRAKAPDLGILILSGYAEEQYAVNLIRHGASGYLNKECEPVEIVNAVRADRRADGDTSPRPLPNCWRNNSIARTAAPFTRPCPSANSRCSSTSPTARRRATSREALSLSVKTVSTYRTRLMEKMNLASNSDLTYYALKNKLIDEVRRALRHRASARISAIRSALPSKPIPGSAGSST